MIGYVGHLEQLVLEDDLFYTACFNEEISSKSSSLLLP